MVASFAFMVAVIVILFRMQDHPLSQWGFFISLNATIAIFITAAKSSAMFVVAACISQSKWRHFRLHPRKLHELDILEDASRGPWGSLRLLATTLPWKLATIGAFATVLALGVDTFAQQVISVDTRDVRVGDGRASFGLAHTYHGGTMGVAGVSDWFQVDGRLTLHNPAAARLRVLRSNMPPNQSVHGRHLNAGRRVPGPV